MERTRRGFRDAILAVANCAPGASELEIHALKRQLRVAFLRYGSETPDNTACVEHVEAGAIDDGTSARRPTVGLRVANGKWPLSSVMNSAEGCPVPAQVAADFPRLTQVQWDAVLRMATMLLLAFESEPLVADD